MKSYLVFFRFTIFLLIVGLAAYSTVRSSYANSPFSEIIKNCATQSTLSTSTPTQAIAENSLRGLLDACPGREIIIPKQALAGKNRLFIKDAESYVSEPKPLYGMGAFYNTIRRIAVGSDGDLIQLEPDAPIIGFDGAEWIGLAGRFKVLLISAPGGEISFENNAFILSWPTEERENVRLFLGTSRDAGREVPALDVIRYSNLWSWLGALSRAVEWALVFVQKNIASNWGAAIIVFGLLIKILLLPVTMMTNHFQRGASQCQATIEPRLAEIAAKFDGEEAHNRTMAEYKALGITPFYALKPLIGLFIQIPILVAIFNALGEMPQFSGQSFLWINDLAYPDAVMNLPFTIPFFGSTVNLLPFLMTAFSLVATLFFRNPHATPKEIRREKRNLCLMAVAFFVLFYPFPASMVLYWTVANVFFFMQQQLLKL